MIHCPIKACDDCGLCAPVASVLLFIQSGAYGGDGMDNLTMRRLLAFAGIAIITAGMIGIVYGIFNNNTVIQLLGLAGVVIAYLISVQVKRMRKAQKAEENK
jgi:hypothetical protein